MQKFLFALGILGFVLSPSLVFALINITPVENVDPDYLTGDPLTSNCTSPSAGASYLFAFDSTGANIGGEAQCNYFTGAVGREFYAVFNTTGTILNTIVSTDTLHSCVTLDLEDCRNDASYLEEQEICIDGADCFTEEEEPPPDETASSTTASTTAMLASIAFGLNIILVILFIGIIGYLWNSVWGDKNKLKPWQK